MSPPLPLILSSGILEQLGKIGAASADHRAEARSEGLRQVYILLEASSLFFFFLHENQEECGLHNLTRMKSHFNDPEVDWEG